MNLCFNVIGQEMYANNVVENRQPEFFLCKKNLRRNVFTQIYVHKNQRIAHKLYKMLKHLKTTLK